MSKKKNFPLLKNIEITDFAAEGKAIARIDGIVVFVPYVVPGDVVDLQVVKKKHSFMEAKAVKFHKYSDFHVPAFCPHFGVCGGCKWQTLDYKKQIEYKQKQVIDCLERIAKVKIPSILPIIGAEHTQGYRNKLEFSFSNKRWLTEEEIEQEIKYKDMNAVGFHIPGAFDKVLNIEKCYLMQDLQNRVRNSLRDFATENHISFFDLRAQTGVLRNLMFRSSNSGEVMLVVQFHIIDEIERGQAKSILKFLENAFPELTTILWVNNLKCNDTMNDLNIEVYKGQGFVYELMENLKFKVGPKSFYQTNNEQAYNLYKTVRNFCNFSGNELVYDLYTGTGTIANFVAKYCCHVIGIEYVPEAIKDAKENAQLNNIKNVIFLVGDMKDVLTTNFIKENGHPDIVITDPPRVGMHKDVVNVILKAAPKRIIYVSCNPATQARDVALLSECYNVEAIQPVDMFPHTQHIENVIFLEAKEKTFHI